MYGSRFHVSSLEKKTWVCPKILFIWQTIKRLELCHKRKLEYVVDGSTRTNALCVPKMECLINGEIVLFF